MIIFPTFPAGEKAAAAGTIAKLRRAIVIAPVHFLIDSIFF
jgi:uncharacterized membrane protein YadS